MKTIYRRVNGIENPNNYLIKKWGISGMAMVDASLKRGKVVVHAATTPPPKKQTGPHKQRIELAKAHEFGHIAHFEDRIDNEPDASLKKFSKSRDTWLLEVDAWIRALNESEPLTPVTGMFVLDCLYSYAKAYTNEEEWEKEKAVICSYARSPQAEAQLLKYQPEEPPPGEEPPSTSIEFGEVSEDEMGGQGEGGDEDNNEGKGDGPGVVPGKGRGAWDDEKSKTWEAILSPEGMAEVMKAKTPKDLEKWVLSKGLKPYKDLPPIVKAMRTGW